jgi:hypothetical protein
MAHHNRNCGHNKDVLLTTHSSLQPVQCSTTMVLVTNTMTQ